MKTETQIHDELARAALTHQQRVARLHELRDRLAGNVEGARASLAMTLSRYADGDDDSIDNVLTMATRAMAAAEAAKLIPTLIETLERQQESRSLALQRELQVANSVMDELNHRRGVVERQAAEHGEVDMNAMTRYLKFASTEFGQAGLDSAMANMAEIGQQARAGEAVAYLRARGEIPEAWKTWAA